MWFGLGSIYQLVVLKSILDPHEVQLLGHVWYAVIVITL